MSSTALLDRFIDTAIVAFGTVLLIGIPMFGLALAAIYLRKRSLARREAQDRAQIGSNAYTSLMHYSYFGKIQEARDALANGEDVNQIDNMGNTPLHYACGQKKFLNREMIIFLVSSGANREAKNNRGKNPFVLLKNKSDRELVQLLTAPAR